MDDVVEVQTYLVRARNCLERARGTLEPIEAEVLTKLAVAFIEVATMIQNHARRDPAGSHA